MTPDAALRRAGARQRRVGARLEAALHAQLGQARRLGARAASRRACASSASQARRAKYWFAVSAATTTRASCHDAPAPSSRASAASRAARLPPNRSISQLACRPTPALVAATGRLTSWRPRLALAVASSVGSSAAPAAVRVARASAMRARGAGDRRARGFGGVDQAGEQRVVELRPPAAQLGDVAVVRQRRLPRRRDGGLGAARRPGRGAAGQAEGEGERHRRQQVAFHGGRSLRCRAPATAAGARAGSAPGAPGGRPQHRQRGAGGRGRSAASRATRPGPRGRCTSRPTRRPTRRAARPDDPVLGQASARRRLRRRRARPCARARALAGGGVAATSRRPRSTPSSAAAMTASPLAAATVASASPWKTMTGAGAGCGAAPACASRAGVGQRVAPTPGQGAAPPARTSSPRTPRRRRGRRRPRGRNARPRRRTGRGIRSPGSPPSRRPRTGRRRRRGRGRSGGVCMTWRTMPARSAGSPCAAPLVGGREPVPALVRVRARAPAPGRGRRSPRACGQLVHSRAGGEVVGVLGAAVQHDDQRQRLAVEAGRREQLERAGSGRAGEAAGDEAAGRRDAVGSRDTVGDRRLGVVAARATRFSSYGSVPRKFVCTRNTSPPTTRLRSRKYGSVTDAVIELRRCASTPLIPALMPVPIRFFSLMPISIRAPASVE